MKFAIRFGFVVLLLAAMASAGTITYTEQAVASGTLGANSFTNATVILTLTGDTTNVVNQGGGFFSNTVGTFTGFVGGIGTFTFTDSLQVFDNQVFSPPAAGFGSLTAGGSILDTFSNVFATYDLTTAIGPITGASFIRPDLFFGTSLGTLNIQSAGDSTFTATAVPEPGSLLLLGTGLSAMAGVIRRKLRA